MATYQAYVSDPEVRRRSWRARGEHPAWRAEPNAAHLALAGLATSAIDTWVITQNIDGLHQKAGTPGERVVELHGSMSGVVCVSCGDRSPMKEALARVEAGEVDPDCPRCGGDPEIRDGHVWPAARSRGLRPGGAGGGGGCDLFLAIGSTLTVEPAASLCGLAAGAGAALVIVNADATPYDGLAAEVIREPIGTAVPPDRGAAAGGAARRQRAGPGVTPGPRHQAQARTPRRCPAGQRGRRQGAGVHQRPVAGGDHGHDRRRGQHLDRSGRSGLDGRAVAAERPRAAPGRRGAGRARRRAGP